MHVIMAHKLFKAKALLEKQSNVNMISDCSASGLDIIVAARVRESGQVVISGNMELADLKEMVANLGSDQEIIKPLSLPDIPMPYDELCMNRKALESYSLKLKQTFLPGRKGLGKAKFSLWTKRVDVASYCRSAKVIK